MIQRIVTHPGGAHKDDFLAVCLLIAKTSAPVERKVPTPLELDDPGVVVIDIGGRHEPELNNFDHHHFPREHAPTCALSLVLAHLGLYEDAKVFCDWLEPAEWFDSRGPNKTAEWLGVSRDVISRLNSPVDVTFLRRFARVTMLQPGEILYEAMRFIGDDLLDFLKMADRRLHLTDEHAETWALSARGTPFAALFLPRGDHVPEEPSASLARYVRARGLNVAALVYPDRRGEGYGMSRYEDHPRLDFSRLGQEADVHFAHVSGFMCKTSARDHERLKDLLVAAWV